MPLKINRAIFFAILLGIVLSFRILSRSDERQESIDTFVENHQAHEAVIEAQIAAEKKRKAEFEARHDWLVGKWQRQYDPDLNQPDWLVFERNHVVTNFYYTGDQRQSRYHTLGREVSINAGRLVLFSNSDDSELSSKDGIVYSKIE